MQRTRQRQSGPTREALIGARDQLGRWTNLRPDLGKLEPDEQLEVVRLVRAASGGASVSDAERFNPGKLPENDQRRLEELVEKAAGKPGAFHAQREAKASESQFVELARSARRLRVGEIEERSLLAELHARVLEGHLDLSYASCLLALVMQWVTGEPFSPGATFAGSGEDAVLHVDMRRGLYGGRDPDGIFAASKAYLDHLGRYGWLSIERNGPSWEIALGPRTLAALGKAEA